MPKRKQTWVTRREDDLDAELHGRVQNGQRSVSGHSVIHYLSCLHDCRASNLVVNLRWIEHSSLEVVMSALVIDVAFCFAPSSLRKGTTIFVRYYFGIILRHPCWMTESAPEPKTMHGGWASPVPKSPQITIAKDLDLVTTHSPSSSRHSMILRLVFRLSMWSYYPYGLKNIDMTCMAAWQRFYKFLARGLRPVGYYLFSCPQGGFHCFFL
jgi:hypothetical protein